MKPDETFIPLADLQAIEDICISIVNRDGEYICYSKGCEIIDGYQKTDVLGQTPSAVFSKSDRIGQSKSLIEETLNTGKTIKNYLNSYQTTHGKKITALCNTYPIFDAAAQLNYVICTYREVTDYLNMISVINKQQLELKEAKGLDLANGTQYTFSSIIGESPALQNAIYQSEVAAATLEPVLLCGETGTGKELFAQSIHNASTRSGHHFVAINCASIPDNLLESTLFGTVKGSFTGALNTRGLFEEAKGSTLFLDEINSMDIKLQAKLLRVLETGTFRKVGSTEEMCCDVRIISAINEDPFVLIKNNQLRSDLYYRLAVFTINIPPLRNRGGDIQVLATHFLNTMAPMLGKKITQLSPEAIHLFNQYAWPGNIRELRHILHQSICLSKNDDLVLNTKTLPDHLYHSPISPALALSNVSDASLKTALDAYERNLIHAMLVKNQFNVSKTAQQLEISRQSLHYKINKYQLLREDGQ
ncbi:sigma-54 interaction domain-containing protein [Acetobacterium wieringae]|uniref:sigma-54 interaction domain-containing protein n=1 Tax=Acetobacterium wieringae TaxID=52694 RepID=UPI00315806CE